MLRYLKITNTPWGFSKDNIKLKRVWFVCFFINSHTTKNFYVNLRVKLVIKTSTNLEFDYLLPLSPSLGLIGTFTVFIESRCTLGVAWFWSSHFWLECSWIRLPWHMDPDLTSFKLAISSAYLKMNKDMMTNWLTDWLTDWLTVWLTDWLTNWLTDRLTNRLTDSLTHWLTDWLTHCLTDLLTNWLTTDWPTDWLNNWMAHPLTARLTDWSTY